MKRYCKYFLFAVLVMISVSASKGKFDSVRLNINYKNTDIREVLKEFEKQTGILILMSDEVKGKININLRNEEIDKALKKILKPSGYYFGLLLREYYEKYDKELGFYIGKPKIKLKKELWDKKSEKHKEQYMMHVLLEEFLNTHKEEMKELKSIGQEKYRQKALKEREKQKEKYLKEYKQKINKFQEIVKGGKCWEADVLENKIQKSGVSKGRLELIDEKKLDDKDKKILRDEKGNKKIEYSRSENSISFYNEDGKLIKKENYSVIKNVYFSPNKKSAGVLLNNNKFIYKDRKGNTICIITNIMFGAIYKISDNGNVIAAIHTCSDDAVGYAVYNDKGKLILRDDEAYESSVNFSKDGKYILVSSGKNLDLYTIQGSLIWRKWFPVFGRFNKTIISSNNLIYTQYKTKEKRPDNKVIVCLNFNGEIVWIRRLRYHIEGRFNLVNNEKNIIFYCHKGGYFLGCLDSINGELVWFTNFNNKGYGPEPHGYKVFRMNEKYSIILLINCWNKEFGYYILAFNSDGVLIADKQINLEFRYPENPKIELFDNIVKLTTSKTEKAFIIKDNKH